MVVVILGLLVENPVCGLGHQEVAVLELGGHCNGSCKDVKHAHGISVWGLLSFRGR